MTWCETNRVDFVFGLARNARLSSLGDILAAPATCDLARDIQSRMRRPSACHLTQLR